MGVVVGEGAIGKERGEREREGGRKRGERELGLQSLGLSRITSQVDSTASYRHLNLPWRY